MIQKPMHVLLVEDNPDQSELVQRILKRQEPPIQVTAVARGEDCFDLVCQNTYSAVLLDYSLPGMDGLAVLKELRNRGHELPIVMVTGQGDERVAVEAMRDGASDYLIKTTGYLTTLPTILSKVLKQHELAMENVRLYHEAQQRAQEQSALNAIARAVSQSLEVDGLLRLALDTVLKVTGREVGYFRLLDDEKGTLHLTAYSGFSDAFIEPYRIAQPPGKKAGQVLASTAPLVLNSAQEMHVRQDLRAEGIRAMAWIPLVAKDQSLGLLNLATRKDQPFEEREVEFLGAIGKVIGIAVENARLFEQIKKQAVELKSVNKVKSEFLSIMSHELRTPLHAIMGYAGMMEDGVLGVINDEQKRGMQKILNYSEDLLAMITSILQATKIEAEAVKVDSQEVDLPDFLDKLRSSYDVPLNKKLTLRWDYPSKLPVLKSDSEKLRHILQNLINNAIKFTREGHVAVSAHLSPPTRTVEFKVADTGIGIAKEALPIIFDMFRQADSSETRSFSGVGLGLYIVKS
ncbi:MAG: response regulator, partial [Candidatus Binatia bacterium]